MVSVMRAPVCSSLETTSPPRRLRSSTSESPVDFSVELTSSPVVAIGLRQPAGGVDQRLGDLLRAVFHQLHDRGGLLREALRDLVEAAFHHLREVGGELGEFLGDVVGLEVEARGQPVAGAGDGVAGLLAGALEPLEQVAAALAERADHGIAGAAERERDVLALLGQRLGDLLRAVVDPLGDVVADRGDVVRQIEMHAGDRVAHLFGLADQRVALMRERLEQAADADFVVVVGAFERRHLVGDQRFELGGARERALDAVAHGRDLAADGLADGDDRIRGRPLPARQAAWRRSPSTAR